MVKKAEVINWARSLADRGIGHDQDGAFGAQCVDLPNGASSIFFGKALWGNGIDMLNSAKGAGYTVVTSGNIKAGAFFCMRVNGHSYGHTGLVIEDWNGTGPIKTIEQNVDGGAIGAGGPARYKNRSLNDPSIGTIIGWFYPPYEDLDSSYGGNEQPGYVVKNISYGGHTFNSDVLKLLLNWCVTRNLLPSGCITQLYLESWWGDSTVGRNDNNWSGMSGGAQTRPSGVVVGTGTSRPANEGGTYFHYKNIDDFMNDWTYLIGSDFYKVAGKKDISGYSSGLFRTGGAQGDYAAVGFSRYNADMTSLRNGINSQNGNMLDEMDQAWANGTLMSGIGNGIERESETMDFGFNIINDEPQWNPGTIYFYNGAINAIQGFHNSEEFKYIQEVYKETTGRTLKVYQWDAKHAPVYVRLFGTLQPSSSNAEISAKIQKLIDQLNSEI